MASASAGSPSRAKSAAPAGTVLKGIQFHQGKPEPVALPDEEYPTWLWTLLDEPATANTAAAKRSQRVGERVEVTIKGHKVTMDKKELRRKNRDNIRVSWASPAKANRVFLQADVVVRRVERKLPESTIDEMYICSSTAVTMLV